MEAIGYHGEMDLYSRYQSYIKSKTNEVSTIVATKAFGIGIDKTDIRNLIRNGVPESMISWTQELGRAERDGAQANAVMLYRKTDITHASPWVLNNLSNKSKCNHILSNFSELSQFVNAHLARECRRRILVNMLGENETHPEAKGVCCDVCRLHDKDTEDFKEELEILVDALKVIGPKGETKISKWICGSKKFMDKFIII